MVARRMLKDLYVCVSGTVNWNLLLAHITKLVKLGAVTHNYLTLLEFPELVFPTLQYTHTVIVTTEKPFCRHVSPL
jgi:hypothetical protein